MTGTHQGESGTRELKSSRCPHCYKEYIPSAPPLDAGSEKGEPVAWGPTLVDPAVDKLLHRLRNSSYGEGMEECEGGSARRQEKAYQQSEKTHRELLALYASPVVPEPVAPMGDLTRKALQVCQCRDEHARIKLNCILRREEEWGVLCYQYGCSRCGSYWSERESEPVGSSNTERRYTLAGVAEMLDEAAREDRAWHGEKLRIGYRNAAKWLRSAAAEGGSV